MAEGIPPLTDAGLFGGRGFFTVPSLFGGGGGGGPPKNYTIGLDAMESLLTSQGFGDLMEQHPELFQDVSRGTTDIERAFFGVGPTFSPHPNPLEFDLNSRWLQTGKLEGLSPFERRVTDAVAWIQRYGNAEQVDPFLRAIPDIIRGGGFTYRVGSIFQGASGGLAPLYSGEGEIAPIPPLPEGHRLPPGPIGGSVATINPLEQPATLDDPQPSPPGSSVWDWLQSVLRGADRGFQLNTWLEQILAAARGPGGFQYPDININFPGQIPASGDRNMNLEGQIGGLLGQGVGLASQILAMTRGGNQALPGGALPFNMPGLDIAPQGTIGAAGFSGGVCGKRASNPHQIMRPDPCHPERMDTYVKAPKAIFKVSVRGPRRGCRRR